MDPPFGRFLSVVLIIGGRSSALTLELTKGLACSTPLSIVSSFGVVEVLRRIRFIGGPDFLAFWSMSGLSLVDRLMTGSKVLY